MLSRQLRPSTVCRIDTIGRPSSSAYCSSTSWLDAAAATRNAPCSLRCSLWTQKRARSTVSPEKAVRATLQQQRTTRKESITGRPHGIDEDGMHGSARSDANVQADNSCRYNAVGVQLLSGSLHRQLFPSTSPAVPALEEGALSLSQHHLRLHGLEPEQASSTAPIAFDLPPLQGDDLDQHFWNIGRQAAQPWLGMAHALAKETIAPATPQGITTKPEASLSHAASDGALAPVDWLALDPETRARRPLRSPKWLKMPGWVRYPILRSADGASALGMGVPVEYPAEEDGALVFDVETMVQQGGYAVMATAANADAWYSWLSPWLLQQGPGHEHREQLIPFGPSHEEPTKTARVLVGHHINFDRARIRDEYSLQRSNIRFLDTMSMHAATRGISSPQRGAWNTYHKAEKLLEASNLDAPKKDILKLYLEGKIIDPDVLASHDLDTLAGDYAGAPMPGEVDGEGRAISTSHLWQPLTSQNSLADVAKLHFNIDLDKSKRSIFVTATDRSEILDRLEECLGYCATDVFVTHKVFTKVWPTFVENCPNPATMAGVLGLSSAILPVDSEWNEYLKRSEDLNEASTKIVYNNLVELAEELRARFTKGVSYEEAMVASIARSSLPRETDDSLSQGERLKLQKANAQRKKLAWELDPWASQLDWTPKKPKMAKPAKDATTCSGPKVTVPRWYRDKVLNPATGLGTTMTLTPAILRLSWNGQPFLPKDGQWTAGGSDATTGKCSPLSKVFLRKDAMRQVQSELGAVGNAVLDAIRAGEKVDSIRLHLRKAADTLTTWASEHQDEVINNAQLQLLDWTAVEKPTEKETRAASAKKVDKSTAVAAEGESDEVEWWPQWYWSLYKSATGKLEITVGAQITPLLLHLAWQGCPLHKSRQHGWVFRYDPQSGQPLLTRQSPLHFNHDGDQAFRDDIHMTVAERLDGLAHGINSRDAAAVDLVSIRPTYYKVPHAGGIEKNVGSPFAKAFMPFFEKGTMRSEHAEERSRLMAKSALDTNAHGSYWVSARDRIKNQLVIWEGEGGSSMRFEKGASGFRREGEGERGRRKGLILPQVIPMGTVTRRAIERTWLTASNAKKNRIGSELKSMVKAPPGYAIVGADVDSQELWICSVMGDAQFGLHGATAVGWMTLEGSKAMGTDLHSKTATILGTDRNQAKVFNYSRIYGAGLRHSSQLLLQAWPDMTADEAMRRAKALYANTKGTNTQTTDFFARQFWFGGTESFVFNMLEGIAQQEKPVTPALGCGVTVALQRKFLPKRKQKGGGKFSEVDLTKPEYQDFMPSRLNWVVQSSGVDYLHLLITAMEHLTATYGLHARFMISVHDEVRYLCREEDRDRVALALQVANLWTRAMFAHRLQMDSLPQSVGFFSQVDLDKVLRKETNDPCVTPSQPDPLPFGESIDICETLKRTHGGSLFADGRPMHGQHAQDAIRSNLDRLAASCLVPSGHIVDTSLPAYAPTPQEHRSLGDRGLRFLQAQAASDISEIAGLEARVSRGNGSSSNGLPMYKSGERRAASAAKDVPSDSSSLSDMDEIALILRQQDEQKGSPDVVGAHQLSRPRIASGDVRKQAQLPQSARISTAAMHTSALPPLLRSIVAAFPPKASKPHVPIKKQRPHRFTMLWEVYAKLIRHTREYDAIRRAVRRRMRAKRSLTHPHLAQKEQEKAAELLAKLVRARNGEEAVQCELAAMSKAIAEEEYRSYWAKREAAFEQEEQEASKPKPRMTGGIIPPTLFNVPLPRFKPVQPDHINMMIKKRRLARHGREVRLADTNELIRQVQHEFDGFRRAGMTAPLEGRAEDWTDALREHGRKPMVESNARDVRRQGTVASAKLLSQLQRIRRHRRLKRNHDGRVRAEQRRKEAAADASSVKE